MYFLLGAMAICQTLIIKEFSMPSVTFKFRLAIYAIQSYFYETFVRT